MEKKPSPEQIESVYQNRLLSEYKKREKTLKESETLSTAASHRESLQV